MKIVVFTLNNVSICLSSFTRFDQTIRMFVSACESFTIFRVVERIILFCFFLFDNGNNIRWNNIDDLK